MWAHLVVVLLGLWTAAAPAVLGLAGAARTNAEIAGPLIVTCAMMALWDVLRGVRWMNMLFGSWLILAPWILAYGVGVALLNSSASGLLVTALSLVKGTANAKSFGGGWRVLWR